MAKSKSIRFEYQLRIRRKAYACGLGGLPKSLSTALWWARKAQAQGFEPATAFIDHLMRLQREEQAAATAGSPPPAPSTSSYTSLIPVGTRVKREAAQPQGQARTEWAAR